MMELQPKEEEQLPRQIQRVRSFVKDVILKDEELRDKYRRNEERDTNVEQ